MKKTIAALIDEVIITDIKIHQLSLKRNKNSQDEKKVQELKSYHAELCKALDKSKAMKKSLATLVDELTITNIKIFNLVDKIRDNKHTRLDAKKAQDLNSYRSELCNAINREFKERENIKI